MITLRAFLALAPLVAILLLLIFGPAISQVPANHAGQQSSTVALRDAARGAARP